jgi:hypothetical protein
VLRPSATTTTLTTRRRARLGDTVDVTFMVEADRAETLAREILDAVATAKKP